MSLSKISEFKIQRKLNRSLIQKSRYYEDMRMSHRAHQCGSWLAPTGSSYLKKNRVTTNPEYTNTQQDLPDYGIYLADS